MHTCEFLPWSFHYQDFEPCCIWDQEKRACEKQNMLIDALWNRFWSLDRWNVFPYNHWRLLTVALDRRDRTFSISAIAIADDRLIAEKCFHIIADDRWQRFQRSGDHMETTGHQEYVTLWGYLPIFWNLSRYEFYHYQFSDNSVYGIKKAFLLAYSVSSRPDAILSSQFYTRKKKKTRKKGYVPSIFVFLLRSTL